MALSYLSLQNSYRPSTISYSISSNILNCSTLNANTNTLAFSTLLTQTINSTRAAFSTINISSIVTSYANVTGNTDISGTLTISGYNDLSYILTSTFTSFNTRLINLMNTCMYKQTWYRMSGRVIRLSSLPLPYTVDYYLSDAYYPRADGGGTHYGTQWRWNQ